MMSRDKLRHVFAGIAIAALLYPFGMVASAAAVMAAAFAKEAVWDGWLRRGTADITDAAATMAGGAFYIAWMWVLG